MGTPRPEVRLDAGGQRGIRDSFMQLKEMGMSTPHTDPNNLRPASRWKAPEAVEREEEGGKLNRAKIPAQFLFCLGANVTEKGQREMNLSRGEPPDTGNAWIQPNEQLHNWGREIETNEKALRSHHPRSCPVVAGDRCIAPTGQPTGNPLLGLGLAPGLQFVALHADRLRQNPIDHFHDLSR